MEFIRRIDKNAGCSAYTRVVVQSNQLGLAVLQYFFKGVVERPFEVVNYRPKKPIPTNFATPQRQFLPASTPNSVASGTRSRKRKERPSAKEEYEENEGSATDEGYPYYTMAPQVTSKRYLHTYRKFSVVFGRFDETLRGRINVGELFIDEYSLVQWYSLNSTLFLGWDALRQMDLL